MVRSNLIVEMIYFKGKELKNLADFNGMYKVQAIHFFLYNVCRATVSLREPNSVRFPGVGGGGGA